MVERDKGLLVVLGVLALGLLGRRREEKKEERIEKELLAGVPEAKPPEKEEKPVEEIPEVKERYEKPTEEITLEAKRVAIELPVKPPPEEVYEKKEVVDTCPPMFTFVGVDEVPADADTLERLFFYPRDEAEAIARYGLAKIRRVLCRDPYGNVIPGRLELVKAREYTLYPEIAKTTWLWIRTDLDCRSVQCLAFWNDAYAYPISYDPGRGRYRYFVQVSVKKLVFDSNEVYLTELGTVCGYLKIVQQSYPFGVREKRICVDMRLDEVDVDL
jgi:hypothetical protein